jgi:hypothetical protein
MNELFGNRYVRLGLLTLLLAALIYGLLAITFGVIGIKDFPQFLLVTISVLGSGLLVYKFFADHIQ